MAEYKLQKGANLENSIQSLLRIYEKNKNLYYPFLQEKDLLYLRFLIKILYEKIQLAIGNDSNSEQFNKLATNINFDNIINSEVERNLICFKNFSFFLEILQYYKK